MQKLPIGVLGALLHAAPVAAAPLEQNVPLVPLAQTPLLPSPDLSQVMFLSDCDPGGVTLQIHQLQGAGAAQGQRRERLSGRVQALAWLDADHYLLIHSEGGVPTLEAQGRAAAPRQALDALPLTAVGRTDPSQCGPDVDAFSLTLAPAPETGPRSVAVTVRRGSASFEVRRYLLAVEDGVVHVRARTIQALDPELAPPGHRLRQVVPAVPGLTVAALWQNQPGVVPATRLDLIRPRQGPVAGPAEVQTLVHAGDELSRCVFAKDERLLCHTRAGEEHGWLFVVEPGPTPRLRQLNHAGAAAAFALSPDGGSVAYVGSGGQDGPLVVRDLSSGAQTQAALQQQGGCGGAVTQAQLAWPQPGRLLARGFCDQALYLLPPPGSQLQVAEPTAPPEEPLAPRKDKGSGHKAGRRSATAFWSPRY